MAFVSLSNNNSNNRAVNTAQAVNAALGVSTSGTQVNTANIDNLSDAVICAFLASQPNGHVNNEGQKVLEENKKEADCKCDQAEESPNCALMAYTSTSLDSKVSTDSTCTKSCLETAKTLKSQNKQLTKDLKQSKLMVLGLDEFANKPVVENCDAKTSKTKHKDVRKNNDALIIEEWVLDNEEREVIQPKIEQKTIKLSIPKIEFVKAKQPEKKARKTIKKGNVVNDVKASACWVWKPKAKVIDHVCKHNSTSITLKKLMEADLRNMSYLIDYEEINRGYIAFGGNPKGGKITGKVVTYDYSMFTWVFFLSTKDETSGILKSFKTRIENLVDHKVKVIRCDNETEFKNKEINQFCKMKGILRKYSIARNPQQNGVAERRNSTLIEAARTMLADSKLSTTFWAEAVNNACYVQNRVLVVKPHNKTPYELFHGRTPTLRFMKPFGCPITILNTLDHLGKFNGKADEGFFIGYSLSSKAFRVFNSRKMIVEENLHIRFSEKTLNVVGSRPYWLFDIDALRRTMNYEPITIGTWSNGFAVTKACDNVGQARKEKEPVKDYILLPLWTADIPFSQDPKNSQDDGF
nr:ribonuclease H-like domain-containing protein [Tanacetum cinerariifolium]